MNFARIDWGVSKNLGVLSISRELLLDRNVRVIAITTLVSGVYIGMLTTVLQPFTIGIGVSVAGLGVLVAFGNRFSGLASSLGQPLAGHYSDTFGRKITIILGSGTTIVSMALFLLAAITRNWLPLSAAFVLYGVSTLSSPASQAIVAESVEMEPVRMDIAFSVVAFVSAIPGAIMAYVGGAVADALGYSLIFVIAVLLESFDLLLYVRGLKETMPSDQSKAARRRFSLRSVVAVPRSLLGMFASFAMDAFAFGISSTILYGILYQQFAYSNTEIGLISGTVSLATLVTQYPAARLLVHLGPRKSLALSEGFGALLMVGWFLARSLLAFVALSVVFGLSVATWVPAQQSMIMERSPPEERGSIGGKLAAFRGIVAFPGPIVGGLLYQYFGYGAVPLASLLGVLVTLAMILRLLPERGGRRTNHAAPSSSASQG